MSQRSRRPKLFLGSLVVLFVALAALAACDAPPPSVAEVEATAQAVRLQEPAAVQTAVAAPAIIVAEARATELVTTWGKPSTFYSLVHPARGTLRTIFGSGTPTFFRFEDDFEVTNGPDLHVLIVKARTIPPVIGMEFEDAIDLGRLKGTRGAQNYLIPATTDLVSYWNVLIWSATYKIPFAAAPVPR